MRIEQIEKETTSETYNMAEIMNTTYTGITGYVVFVRTCMRVLVSVCMRVSVSVCMRVSVSVCMRVLVSVCVC